MSDGKEKRIKNKDDWSYEDKPWHKIKSWEEDGWSCTLEQALNAWSPGDVQEMPPSSTVNLINHALAEIRMLRSENEKLIGKIAEHENYLDRAKQVLEPFAKQLAWRFGRYVGDLRIVAKSPHEEVKDEMTFKLHDFRMAHLIWEDLGKILEEKE